MNQAELFFTHAFSDNCPMYQVDLFIFTCAFSDNSLMYQADLFFIPVHSQVIL
jgi:hypothetical protein